jgi:hypothetical protein
MSLEVELELAGLADENGNLGRPIPSGKILVPQKVWLHRDTIRWKMGSRPRHQEVSRNMLNQFVRLSDGKSVLRFAERWGVLALSEKKVRRPGCEESMREGAEPIAAWQYYSRRASALLNVAAALKQEKLGDLKDWGEFARFVPQDGVTPEDMKWVEASTERHKFGLGYCVVQDTTAELRLRYARRLVGNEIERWLDCWKTGRQQRLSDFALRWNDSQQRWELQINYHGLLFPAIALQLALVIADADSLYACSGCGVPYIRSRQRKRPKSGWANYCDQCANEGVAKRKAVEAYREKRSMAVRLHSTGVSVEEIAEQLSATIERVGRWLKEDGKDAQAKARK